MATHRVDGGCSVLPPGVRIGDDAGRLLDAPDPSLDAAEAAVRAACAASSAAGAVSLSEAGDGGGDGGATDEGQPNGGKLAATRPLGVGCSGEERCDGACSEAILARPLYARPSIGMSPQHGFEQKLMRATRLPFCT